MKRAKLTNNCPYPTDTLKSTFGLCCSAHFWTSKTSIICRIWARWKRKSTTNCTAWNRNCRSTSERCRTFCTNGRTLELWKKGGMPLLLFLHQQRLRMRSGIYPKRWDYESEIVRSYKRYLNSPQSTHKQKNNNYVSIIWYCKETSKCTRIVNIIYRY